MYPKNLKEHLKSPVFTAMQEVAEELEIEAYAIGGYVRDLLLKRPSKDIDIVVSGKGIEAAQACAQKLGVNRVNVFKNFGTAQFIYQGFDFEFVGARKESYKRDSRKPIVEDGTIADDQKRRDFTINALAVSLQRASFGEVIDPFNGLQDLADQIIRTPLEPETTFSDDPLRMLRGIRFACQLGFKIEEGVLNAMKEQSKRLEIISQERITDEMNKMILSPRPSLGFKLMFNTELLHQFFPEMVALQGVDIKEGKGHKDNFYHTLEVLENISENTDDLWLRWSAIMHDIAKPPTKRFHPKAGWTFHGHEDLGARITPKIFRRLKLPMDHKMKMVQKLVRLHLRPIALVKDEVTDSAIRRLLFEAGEDFEGLMMLCNADITSKNEAKVEKYKQNFIKVMQLCKEVEERDQVRNMQPPIDGQYIMEYFNIPPSKEIGMIKNQIKEAILDGEIENNETAALELMIEIAKELGLERHERS